MVLLGKLDNVGSGGRGYKAWRDVKVLGLIEPFSGSRLCWGGGGEIGVDGAFKLYLYGRKERIYNSTFNIFYLL